MSTCPICGNVTAAGDEDHACSDCFLKTIPPGVHVWNEGDPEAPDRKTVIISEEQRDEDHFNNAE